MTPDGFTEMMSNVLGATGKKDADVNAKAYMRQLAQVERFTDADGLKASTLLTQEFPLPQNILAYLYRHMIILSDKRRDKEEPKKFEEKYDEETNEIRKKNIKKIIDLGKKCLRGEISTKIMYKKFDKDCPGWFKRVIRTESGYYPYGDILMDTRTWKPYCPQREKEMWKDLELEENKPKTLQGNIAQALTLLS